jgi:3-oxoacyl-[acyl-carrier-protein] synthase III
MRRDISIISAAAILPPKKIIINADDNVHTEFSKPGQQQLSQSRALWRLNQKEELIELMKASLLTALKQAQLDISDINYLILSQVWPDNILGNEAGQLTRELNLSCPIIPINVGTSGGVTALELATAMFSNAEFQNIAVIAGCNYFHWFSENDPARTLLSDGAASLILSREKGTTITACHTLNTSHYDILNFNEAPERYVYYRPRGGEYIFNNFKETIYQCCNKVCKSKGINLNKISAFYIYDPSEWVADSAAEALGVEREKMVSIFHKYGSLGPAQCFLGFIEMQDNKKLTNSDWIIIMGFGPSFTATAVLLQWNNIPYGVYCYDHKKRSYKPILSQPERCRI